MQPKYRNDRIVSTQSQHESVKGSINRTEPNDDLNSPIVINLMKTPSEKFFPSLENLIEMSSIIGINSSDAYIQNSIPGQTAQSYGMKVIEFPSAHVQSYRPVFLSGKISPGRYPVCLECQSLYAFGLGQINAKASPQKMIGRSLGGLETNLCYKLLLKTSGQFRSSFHLLCTYPMYRVF